MNKWLVVWNIVLMVLLLVAFLTGCTGSNSRIDWAVSQIQDLYGSLGQVQNNVNQNTQQIQTLNTQVVALESAMQSLVDQINAIFQAK